MNEFLYFWIRTVLLYSWEKLISSEWVTNHMFKYYCNVNKVFHCTTCWAPPISCEILGEKPDFTPRHQLTYLRCAVYILHHSISPSPLNFTCQYLNDPSNDSRSKCTKIHDHAKVNCCPDISVTYVSRCPAWRFLVHSTNLITCALSLSLMLKIIGKGYR